MFKAFAVIAALLMPMTALAQERETPPPDAWVVTVPLRAEGHGSPAFYGPRPFQTKSECEVFRASAEWINFFHNWAAVEFEQHDGEVDFGEGAYCGQVKDVQPYQKKPAVEERGA